MTTLMRWSPVSDLAALEIGRLQRMFDAALAGEPLGWVPAVDVYETTEHDVVVKAELPEMKREDVNVTFENNVLTIEGERKLDATIDRDRYHRVERGTGSFRRSFTMPA